jgi:hypothetical protein
MHFRYHNHHQYALSESNQWSFDYYCASWLINRLYHKKLNPGIEKFNGSLFHIGSRVNPGKLFLFNRIQIVIDNDVPRTFVRMYL